MTALARLKRAINREIDVLAAATTGRSPLTEQQMHMLLARIAKQLGIEVANQPGSALRMRLIDYWWGDAVDEFNRGYEQGMRENGMKVRPRETTP